MVLLRGAEPKSNPTQFKKGYTPWNKGLTKDISKGIERMAKSKLGNLNPMKRTEVRLKKSRTTKGKHYSIVTEFKKGHQPLKHTNPNCGCMRCIFNRKEPLPAKFKVLSIRPNKPERKLIELLKDSKLPYEYTGDYSVIIGNKNPDFVNVNGQKKIIELFGDYWHSPKNKHLRWHSTEKGTKEVYSKYGFKTLVIWQHELNDTQKVLQKLLLFEKT